MPVSDPVHVLDGGLWKLRAMVTQGERWIDATAFDVGCSAEPGEGRVLLCVAGPSAPAALSSESHQVVLQVAAVATASALDLASNTD